jgi:hypothetical protein
VQVAHDEIWRRLFYYRYCLVGTAGLTHDVKVSCEIGAEAAAPNWVIVGYDQL